MKIDDIYLKMTISDMFVYQIDKFKPFIDLYFYSKKKTRFKLFHSYIFNYTHLVETFNHKFESKHFCRPNNLNFKYKKVQSEFELFKDYFIGYNKYELPLFLHLTLFKTDQNNLSYNYSGFSQMLENQNSYNLRFDDYKEFDDFKNIPIELTRNYDKDDPLSDLSSGALNTLNKLKQI
jgi:hypothetical protein